MVVIFIKNNYSIICEEILNNFKEKKKLLLHSCCAPCSSYVISYLTNFFDITVLYYNPNIYPYEEDEKRKNEQLRLVKSLKTKNKISFIDCDYDNDKYILLIKGLEKEKEKGKRCNICYQMRMEKAAVLAKKGNYDYFCTTLSVSPYKNVNLINEIGEN